jgi:hypothetical protein
MDEQQYYNLVFIRHKGKNKNYLFNVPLNIRLKASNTVFTATSKGESFGMCMSDSFIVGEHETACIMMGAGAYYPLKDVIGFAKKQEGYRLIDFRLAEVPF